MTKCKCGSVFVQLILNAGAFSGSIVVDGHELHEEDLRLMYTFDQRSGSATQYEAHSDAQVLAMTTTHTHHSKGWLAERHLSL